MLDIGLTLIDRFIQLLTERRTVAENRLRNRRGVIEDLVDPLASDMEKILQNYLSILESVESKVSNPAIDPSVAIGLLRSLRQELEPLRVKVRAMAVVFLNEYRKWDSEPERVVLLRQFATETGGVFGAFAWAGFKNSEAEEARIFFDTSLTSRLLYTLEYVHQQSESHAEWRREGVRNINSLRHALKLRWENFAVAYAELRTSFLAPA